MSLFILGVIVVINSLIMIENKRLGVCVYLCLAFLCPNAWGNGDYIVSYDILASIAIIIIWGLWKIKRKDFFIEKKMIPIFLVFFLSVLSTFISYFRYGCEVNYAGLYACVRYPLLVLVVIECGVTKKDLVRLLEIILSANYIMCVIQLFIVGFYKIFNKLYLKSYAGFEIYFQQKSHERFTRLFGFFGSPSLAGFFFFVGTIVFFIKFFEKKEYTLKNWLFFTMSLGFGIGTATKTFTYALVIVGVILCLDLIVRRSLFKGGEGLVIKWKPFACSIVTVMLMITVFLGEDVRLRSTIPIPSRVIYALEYRFGLGDNDNQVTEQKQSDEVKTVGSTIPMLEALEGYERFIGVGETSPKGEHVVDSALMIMIHRIGFIGIAVFLGWQIWILLLALKYKSRERVALLAIIIFMQLAVPTIYSIIGTWVLAYIMIGMNEDRKSQIGVQHADD